MKKILFLLGLIILISSCEKEEEDNLPGKNLIGTWELRDDGGLSRFDETKYWIFTEDDHFYELYEDDFGIRDMWSRLYCVVDDVVSLEFELIRFTVDNNEVTFEILYDGHSYFATFEKTADVDYETWLIDFEVGYPEFTVSIDDRIDGLAWTGQKLWVVDWPWSSRLVEIDINNGAVLQDLYINYCHGSIAYGNNTLITGYNGALYFRNPVNGSQTGNISVSTYGTIDAITYDGSDLWFFARVGQGYEFALVKCDFSGNIKQSVIFNSGVDDLAYGNGFLWIAMYDNIIKFNTNTFQAVENYQIQNITHSGGNLSIEFINGQLWIVDGQNNFYVSGLN